MSMPRTYITYDDCYDEGTNRRIQGREVCLDHSESDLRLHRYAGIAAVVVLLLMVVAVVGVSVS